MVKFMKNKMKTNQIIVSASFAILFSSCNLEKPENSNKSEFVSDSIQMVSGYGRIGAYNDITDITPEVGGVVDEIFVEEGDSLVAGDTILALVHDEALLKINSILADLEVIQSGINVLDNQILTKNMTVQNRGDYLKRIRNAYQSGSESKQAVANAELDYTQSKGQLEDLKLQKETRKNEYMAKSEQLKIQELFLDQHFIQSPGDGSVLLLNTDVNKPVQPLQSVGKFR